MIDVSLDILGNEWIIIIFVALILLLGTKRLPEASRKIGKIVGEYNKTKNVVQNEFQKTRGDLSIPVEGPVMSERQKLETIAKSLDIDYTNKTDNDLRDLITSKLGKPNAAQGSDQSSKQ
jgi:sec-independent protein translocase protein TatA